jgi:hypothetical protein
VLTTAILLFASVAGLGLWGAQMHALWRGWRYTSRDRSAAEGRLAVLGLLAALGGVLILVASGGSTAGWAVAGPSFVGFVVLTCLSSLGTHRRREQRIRAQREARARRGS